MSALKRTLAIFHILMFMILFFSFCQNVPPEAGAEIVFENDIHDFGQIEQGAIVTHVFKFENIGADTLQIKRVAST